MSQDDLEDLFWPFIKPRIRRALEHFRGRSGRGKRVLNRSEKERLRRQTHLFDKRRVLYLKFGNVGAKTVLRIPAVLIRWLGDKSRDEVEQRFLQMERILRPSELKTYVYAIFDLQRFFKEPWARRYPQSLSAEEMDRYFIGEICKLNDETNVWYGCTDGRGLNHYLVRYLVMHFDHEYPAGNMMSDYMREFINRHRIYSPPRKSRGEIFTAAQEIFGQTRQELEAVSARRLTRLFRRLAQKLHPDMGGDAEQFIRLTDTYRELIKIKRKA